MLVFSFTTDNGPRTVADLLDQLKSKVTYFTYPYHIFLLWMSFHIGFYQHGIVYRDNTDLYSFTGHIGVCNLVVAVFMAELFVVEMAEND